MNIVFERFDVVGPLKTHSKRYLKHNLKRYEPSHLADYVTALRLLEKCTPQMSHRVAIPQRPEPNPDHWINSTRATFFFAGLIVANAILMAVPRRVGYTTSGNRIVVRHQI